MKSSLNISVYKNVTFLKAVLGLLKCQTEKVFEIIISEDGNDLKMKSFISHYPFEQEHQHVWQEALDWSKNRCKNNLIKAAKIN